MKSSILLYVAGIVCAFGGYAKAADFIPQPSATHQHCLAWAGEFEDTAHREAAEQFCTDRKACRDIQSTGYNSWDRCDAVAKAKFHIAMGGTPKPLPGGGSSTNTEAVTVNADSDYYNLERNDGKGFEFNQGR